MRFKLTVLRGVEVLAEVEGHDIPPECLPAREDMMKLIEVEGLLERAFALRFRITAIGKGRHGTKA